MDKGWAESTSLLLEAGANPKASFMYQGRKWTAEENARDELSRSDGPPHCDWRECIRLLQHHTAMRMRGTHKVGSMVKLYGLKKVPQLNGQVGTVERPFELLDGRYTVRMADGVARRFKAENCKAV